MANSKKDLQIYLSQNDRIKMLEIINVLGSIETLLAHNPDAVPLDVFLDFSQFVHKWFYLYTNDLYEVGPISYNKLKNLITRLKDWHEDFKKQLIESHPNVVILSTSATQKAINIFTDITVGSAENSEQP